MVHFQIYFTRGLKLFAKNRTIEQQKSPLESLFKTLRGFKKMRGFFWTIGQIHCRIYRLADPHIAYYVLGTTNVK
jgi:hypothetical protein